MKMPTFFTGDNLEVLRGLNDESVDLIYLDPPFNKKKQWNAPIGSKAASAHFKDSWMYDDVKHEWIGLLADKHPALATVIRAVIAARGKPDGAYLTYMAMRLIELHRVLKESGSIYLHCDQTMSHSLKLMMDVIFGDSRYKNEIIWIYGLGGSSKNFFSRKHDTILFYTKSSNYFFQKPLIPATSVMMKGKMKGMPDVWNIPSLNNMSNERTGYPTQKPLALLDRIINASSKPMNTVLDPFCGCATTCVAAARLQRNWIGIDLSPIAAELIKIRLADDAGLFTNFIHRTDQPKRAGGKRSAYKEIKHELYGKQEGRCNGCNVYFEYRNFEVDYIVPVANGGPESNDNKQLLCSSCNRIKGTRSMGEFLAMMSSPIARAA